VKSCISVSRDNFLITRIRERILDPTELPGQGVVIVQEWQVLDYARTAIHKKTFLMLILALLRVFSTLRFRRFSGIIER